MTSFKLNLHKGFRVVAVEVNEGLGDTPEAINEDPYGAGWMVKVRLSDVSEKEALMDAAAYEVLKAYIEERISGQR